MALQRYRRPSLWNDFDLFSNSLQSFFEDNLSEDLTSRNMEVSENKKEVKVKAPVYGVDPKDVEVNVKNNVLTIKGSSKKEETKDDANTSYSSQMKSEFYYQLPLSREVDDEKAEAKVKHGVVTVTIPKSKESKGRTIKVKAE